MEEVKPLHYLNDKVSAHVTRKSEWSWKKNCVKREIKMTVLCDCSGKTGLASKWILTFERIGLENGDKGQVTEWGDKD